MISIYESCWQHQFIISKIHLKTKIDIDSFIKRYPECFFFGTASARSYKIGAADNNWIVGWLVGNAVFSEMAQTIFLIFCMKLGDYKAKKVTEPDF